MACILANIYIPPPFNAEVLYQLMKLIFDKPDVPRMAVGDFNMVPEWEGRYLSTKNSDWKRDCHVFTNNRRSRIGDIWRRNPTKQQYSCFSKTHSTFSRIDLALGSEDLLYLVRNINYMPRGLSDHSLLVVSLSQGEEYCKG